MTKIEILLSPVVVGLKQTQFDSEKLKKKSDALKL